MAMGQSWLPGIRDLEASKGGTKVGRMKDPLYKDSYLGITPPTFILPFEAPEGLAFKVYDHGPVLTKRVSASMSSLGFL